MSHNWVFKFYSKKNLKGVLNRGIKKKIKQFLWLVQGYGMFLFIDRRSSGHIPSMCGHYLLKMEILYSTLEKGQNGSKSTD